MRKNIIYLIILFCASMVYTSCEKADMKSARISRGDGKWDISAWEKIQYDTLGKVVWDSVFNDLGELNFFRGGSLNALYDYRVGVMYLKKMPEKARVYRFEYFTDGNRFNIMLDGHLSDPYQDIAKFYTIQHDGHNKKVLVYVNATTNVQTTKTSNQLIYKEILTIRKD